MLKNKKILFFGTNNEISIAIIENFLKQNAIVSFVSQNEFKDIGILDRIPKNYFVKDYYSTEKIEDIFKNYPKKIGGRKVLEISLSKTNQQIKNAKKICLKSTY